MQDNKLFGHKLAPYPTTFRSGTMQGRSALHIDIPKGPRGLEDANYMLPPCWWSLSQRRCKPRTGCQNMFACKAIIWISKLNFGSLRNRRHMQKMAANPNLHLLGSVVHEHILRCDLFFNQNVLDFRNEFGILHLRRSSAERFSETHGLASCYFLGLRFWVRRNILKHEGETN